MKKAGKNKVIPKPMQKVKVEEGREGEERREKKAVGTRHETVFLGASVLSPANYQTPRPRNGANSLDLLDRQPRILGPKVDGKVAIQTEPHSSTWHPGLFDIDPL